MTATSGTDRPSAVRLEPLSFQAYLDKAEEKTGLTPDKHVGSEGAHRDESATLRLGGVAARESSG